MHRSNNWTPFWFSSWIAPLEVVIGWPLIRKSRSMLVWSLPTSYRHSADRTKAHAAAEFRGNTRGLTYVFAQLDLLPLPGKTGRRKRLGRYRRIGFETIPFSLTSVCARSELPERVDLKPRPVWEA